MELRSGCKDLNFYRFKGVEVELISVKPQFNPEASRMAFYDHFIFIFFKAPCEIKVQRQCSSTKGEKKKTVWKGRGSKAKTL